MIFSWKARFCVLLMLGLAGCQNGDFNPTAEGSGVGSGEGQEGTTMKTPLSTKVFTTSKPEDTTTEQGSGDDEDKNVIQVSTPVPVTTTTTAAPKPTQSPDDEDGSGSGESGDGATDNRFSTKAPSVFTKDGPNIPISWPGQKDGTTSTKSMLTETTKMPVKTRMTTEEKRRMSGKYISTESVTTEAKTTTESNLIEEVPSTKEPTTDIEVINSPTTGIVESTHSLSTTEMSNRIPNDREDTTDDDENGTVNVAAQVGKGQKSKPTLSFTTGIIIGVVAGAILAILVILFLVYRLRKKDEGSYSLEEPITGYAKQEPGSPVSEKGIFCMI